MDARDRGRRLRELLLRWRAADQRLADLPHGSPAWDAAYATAQELETAYMCRLNRILDREDGRAGRRST